MTAPTLTCSWFQSTHSLRSATHADKQGVTTQPVSIHALLAECDLTPAECETYEGGFNPRTPCGVRPAPLTPSLCRDLFQSTHSLRSATFYEDAARFAYVVSIHALLAECDCHTTPGFPGFPGFNPRTPCGVRLIMTSMKLTCSLFQSTHSLRSATRPMKATLTNRKFQSTHSLRSAT